MDVTDALRLPVEEQLGGLIPPLVTPLHEDESLDVASLQRQAAWLTAVGVTGLWVNGTSGEFHALTRRERSEAIAAVRASMPTGAGLLIAQVGAPSTREAEALARDARACGADMVAAVTPYYLSSDEDELTTYYRAIHDAAGLPLLIYQVPMMAKTTLRVDAVLNLAREGTVVGIKDSSGDIGWLRNLTTRAAAEGLFLRAFVGGGALVDVSMLAGAAGAMCVIANLVPAHCRRLVAACVAGDWAVATSLQAELITLIRTLALPGRLNWTTTLSVYKFVLAERAVISSATCTRPIRPLQAGEREGIRTNALPLIERLEGEAGVVAHGSTGRANAHS